MILFVYKLLYRRWIAPQQSEITSNVLEWMDRMPSHWVSCPKFSWPQEGFEMPQYFFHVKRGQVTVLDQEGIELANPAQAEEEATRRAQGCLADDPLKGTGARRGISRGMIIVADENWRRLFELPF
jgi:Domain of unknown function (DUF6894)